MIADTSFTIPSKMLTYDAFLKLTIENSGEDERCKVNCSRMVRLNKQVELNNDFIKLSQQFNPHWTWLLIAEPWCGDGSQSIPVIHKISELFPDINLHIILRDEYPDMILHYHTDGKKAIPKLICFDEENDKELWTWGPRPDALVKELKKLKAENPEISKEDFSKFMHLWYAKDKGHAVQNELFNIIKLWSEK